MCILQVINYEPPATHSATANCLLYNKGAPDIYIQDTAIYYTVKTNNFIKTTCYHYPECLLSIILDRVHNWQFAGFLYKGSYQQCDFVVKIAIVFPAKLSCVSCC